jgi:ATP-dependent helicase/nuclease subunit B
MRLREALKPLETISAGLAPLRELAERHHAVVAAMSASERGQAGAFDGHDGVMLQEAFDDLASLPVDADLEVRPALYPELFETAIGDRVVRKPQLPGVQVRILGPLESRLQNADRVVLGGLVEGVWPPAPRPDPWLSRPMRHALGLDLPERRISLSAHDFAQALGADEVVLAYPSRLGGASTVPSRFVQRLAAVAGEAAWQRVRASGEKYLAWARALDRPGTSKRIARPQPRPPRSARPTALSVTDVEKWLRDPYSIYAKHILKLQPLDCVDAPPDASDRGVLIHAALNEFTRTFADALPRDPARSLIEIGARHFSALEDYPEARAFWWPRFQRIAAWFAEWEAQRRGAVRAIRAEVDGRIKIDLGERVFTLRARADRIEQVADNRYAILDYKTGQVPTDPQVQSGLAPQLTLEAAILQNGGFPCCGAAAVAELVYVSLRGGEPIGEAKPIAFKNGDAAFHAELALSKFTNVARRFEDEEQAYLPLVLPMWKSRYGIYDHLARVMEWSVGRDDEADGGGQE